MPTRLTRAQETLLLDLVDSSFEDYPNLMQTDGMLLARAELVRTVGQLAHALDIERRYGRIALCLAIVGGAVGYFVTRSSDAVLYAFFGLLPIAIFLNSIVNYRVNTRTIGFPFPNMIWPSVDRLMKSRSWRQAGRIGGRV